MLDLSIYMYMHNVFVYWEWGIVGEGRVILGFIL